MIVQNPVVVTEETLREMAREVRNGIRRIYLHWTAGHYGQPHGSDRGAELQHRRSPGRSAKAMTKKNSLYESVLPEGTGSFCCLTSPETADAQSTVIRRGVSRPCGNRGGVKLMVL